MPGEYSTPEKILQVKYPSPKGLSFIHILQTEVKSKMSALKKRLQKEPAFPNGSPAGRSIMRACQIATQACDLRPEGAHRHGQRHPPVRWANTASISGSITAFARRSGSSRAQARTCVPPHGQWGQQTRASASGHQRFAVAALRCDSHF
jgi:hypothetical protein